MPPWRAGLRWIVAGIVLELLWLFVTESWREREPGLVIWLLVLVGPLLGAAWHSVAKPSGIRAAALGALGLAAASSAASLTLDLVSPYPQRFAFASWELARAASLIAGFTVAAWFTASRTTRPWRIGARVLCVASLVFALLVPGVMIYIIVDGSRDNGAPADAALVLGFALAPDGSPQPQLIGRIKHAVELVKQGRVRRLILSGGVARGGHTEAEAMRDLALAAGLPASALVLEQDSRSTIENFACAGSLFERLGVTRVLLVTEPWHMSRAMLLARRHGLDLQQSPATSAIWESPRHASYWLFRDAVALIRERIRDPYASPGVCRARECEGCRTF